MAFPWEDTEYYEYNDRDDSLTIYLTNYDLTDVWNEEIALGIDLVYGYSPNRSDNEVHLGAIVIGDYLNFYEQPLSK